MRGWLRAFAALVAMSISASAALSADAPVNLQPMVFRTGEDVRFGGGLSDMGFAAGGRVTLTAQSPDDIFALGRQVLADAARADHLIAGGGEITVADSEFHDLIAAGGQLRVSDSTITDDAVLAGGRLQLDNDMRIAGSSLLVGGEIRINADIGRDLHAFGGRVELNGPVAGEAAIRAEEIVIGPKARVTRDLRLEGRKIEISPDAVVGGRMIRTALPSESRNEGGAVAAAVAGLLAMIGVALAPGVVAAAAPQVMLGAQRRLRTALGASIGVGALTMLFGPPALLVLALTLVGGPLAMLGALVLVLLVPLGFSALAFALGQLARRRFSAGAAPMGWASRLGWTLLGAAAVCLACALPLIGGLIWLACLFAGVGAVVSWAWQVRRTA